MENLGVSMEEGTNYASAGSWQLEVLNGEGEVIVIRIVDQEAVEDILLDALRAVAGGDERARRSDGDVALLDAGSLRELLPIRLDAIHDDAPLSLDVDGPERLNVASRARTQVSLFRQAFQTVNGVLSVSCDVFVQGKNSLIMLVEGVFDVVGRVVVILQTPGLGSVL